MSSSYHPQTDGQTEIVNKCLEGYLRTYTSDKQGKWTRWLHLAKYWYNTTYHMSAGMSPFKALYGYDPPSIFDLVLCESRCPAARDTLQEMQDIVKSLKDNLSTARNRMKQMADKKRVERRFTEGDMVFVRLQPYKQTSLKGKVRAKLQPKYYGPYRVIHKIGEAAYSLELPKESKLHKIFHVSSLKQQIGDHIVPQTNLPMTDEEGRTIMEPEEILETRTKNLRTKQIKQYKVKWTGMTEEDATWEAEDFVHQFPKLMP